MTLVELHTVGGQRIYVNPHKVALVERDPNAPEDKQSFVVDVTIEGVGTRRVNGSPTEIVKRLVTGGVR